MKVTYFHRKVIEHLHFSVEIIFNDLRRNLPKEVSTEIVTSKYFSKGLLPRIQNGIEAFSRRGAINHVTGDINYIGLFLPRRNTIQTILDCVAMHNLTGIRRYIYQLFWIRIPASRARFVTTISEASKAEIIEFSGCSPDKVKVIPIALSPVFKRTERTYNWDKPRILIVGGAPNKNISNILQALRDLNCQVNIVGKFNPEYKQFLEENKMDHTYQWGLNIAQMYDKYRETDILVFASTYEGFGMPIIEAQATGVPVVTSNISSMPEVGGENSAIFADPYDVGSIREAVLNIMQDSGLREGLIQNGYENIRRFEPGLLSNMYLDLYKKI